jgi:DNA-directed RNA polymerase specialized sigma24 family protein
MNEQDKVWETKEYLTNYINNRYKFFTFIYNDDKVEKYELSLRKEDFISEVLIKAHSKYHLYDKDKSALSTWVTNIARNLYIDILRKKNVANKYIKTMINTTETSTLDLDLDSFKDYLEEFKPNLHSFYLCREKDMDKEDLMLELAIDKREYSLLSKELKQEWENFNN